MQNMIKYLIIALLFLSFNPCLGQIEESFSEGSFDNWTGDMDWFFVDTPHTSGNGSLNANTDGYVLGSKDSATKVALFTETNMAYGEWNFSLTEGSGWSISGTNDYFVVLCSDTNNPEVYKTTETNLDFNGYYLRFDGNSNINDKFVLYRRQGKTKDTVINTNFPEGIDGTASQPRSFRITRTQDGEWSIYINNGWDNYATVLRGSNTDNVITAGQYFGLVTNISTPSTTRVLWFDNLYAGPIKIDEAAPKITFAAAINEKQISLSFSEPLPESILNSSNYILENTENPTSVYFGNTENSNTTLDFENAFPDAQELTLRISGIEDLSGNQMSDTTVKIYWDQIVQGDVVVNEIYFNQADNIQLPPYDFLELYNTTNTSINMTGWKLTIASRIATFPEYIIPSGGFLIIAPNDSYSEYGESLVMISESDLSNTTTSRLVSISDVSGNEIHSITYTRDFYHDADKTGGGWSIEQIDPSSWCQQSSNWQASIDPVQATPGRINSVNGNNIDNTPPSILSAIAASDTTIHITFSESIKAVNKSDFQLSEGILINDAIHNPTATNLLVFNLASKLTEGKNYTLKIPDIFDLCNNLMPAQEVSISYNQIIEGNIVINEILFNPNAGGCEFVELYNTAAFPIAVSQLYITRYGSNGTLELSKQISAEGYVIEPYDYVVLAKTRSQVMQFYSRADSLKIVAISNMPTIPNASGSIVIQNQSGEILDEFSYNENMHTPLLRNKRGVSLERINPDLPTQYPHNWHSAAETYGFATPAYRNSQFKELTEIESAFTISSGVFSPDSDGYEDFLDIRYKLDESGYILNIKIFDVHGRLIIRLADNYIAGTEGEIRWNGNDESDHRVSTGPYLILVEYFDTSGNVHSEKIVCTVAYRK